MHTLSKTRDAAAPCRERADICILHDAARTTLTLEANQSILFSHLSCTDFKPPHRSQGSSTCKGHAVVMGW